MKPKDRIEKIEAIRKGEGCSTLEAIKRYDERDKKLRFVRSVLTGVVPSGNYSGQRRQRQIERIDEAIIAIDEILEG